MSGPRTVKRSGMTGTGRLPRTPRGSEGSEGGEGRGGPTARETASWQERQDRSPPHAAGEPHTAAVDGPSSFDVTSGEEAIKPGLPPVLIAVRWQRVFAVDPLLPLRSPGVCSGPPGDARRIRN